MSRRFSRHLDRADRRRVEAAQAAGSTRAARDSQRPRRLDTRPEAQQAALLRQHLLDAGLLVPGDDDPEAAA